MTIKPLAIAAAFAAGCAGGASPAPPPAPAPVRATKTPIAHVVFIVQENRSFNDLFMDYPGATTAEYGYDARGEKIRLRPANLGDLWDVDHSANAFFSACDGRGRLPGTDCKMDGWDDERTSAGAPRHAAYSYVPRNQTRPYWAMAREYVLADRTFASNLDASFAAHQYTVAAYASRAVNLPSRAWGCEGGAADTLPTLTARRGLGQRIRACFDNPTIADEADAAGLSWRFYAVANDGLGGIWSSFQADRKIFYGPDWTADVINPPSRFLGDIAAGQLANITWVTPTYQTSDHSGFWSTGGPAWVASIVDAIGTSRFWKSTAIFIVWDDWGGWFDPVPPVYEDYDGLGFRVPLIIVSPYAKRGYVTHVRYETASVLRFIEDNFGLPQLAQSDARANDPAVDAFDYHGKPRAFEKIEGARPRKYWQELDRASLRRSAIHIVGDD